MLGRTLSFDFDSQLPPERKAAGECRLRYHDAKADELSCGEGELLGAIARWCDHEGSLSLLQEAEVARKVLRVDENRELRFLADFLIANSQMYSTKFHEHFSNVFQLFYP